VMARLRLLSPFECATLNVLRARSWRWLALDEVVRRTQLYQRRTPRRVIRHHLGRYVESGLVETTDTLAPWPGTAFYRWNASAPTETVASIERAAQAESLLLEPVAEPPTACARGHLYAEHGHQFSDGERRCFACGEVTRSTGGHVYVTGAHFDHDS
jgi:hypothetical protein